MSEINKAHFEPTGDERVDAVLKRLFSRKNLPEALPKDLEDALTATAHLDEVIKRREQRPEAGSQRAANNARRCRARSGDRNCRRAFASI